MAIIKVWRKKAVTKEGRPFYYYLCKVPSGNTYRLKLATPELRTIIDKQFDDTKALVLDITIEQNQWYLQTKRLNDGREVKNIVLKNWGAWAVGEFENTLDINNL